MKRFDGVYFDHAATSYPKPREVKKAVANAISLEGGNPGRSAHTLSLRAAERVFSARETLADFFGLPDEKGVVFTKNATEAINLAVHVFTRKGGHVLCDDMAHNALLRPLYALEERGEITLSLFSARDGIPEIPMGTRLLCATHASNICSHACDAEALGRVCRARGISFVLDASQSAGHLPIDCKQIGADAVCLPAHKGLYGIMGAGAVLFLDPAKEYPSFLSGGSGAQSISKRMPNDLPEHFEAGTLPLPAIAALEAGVRWVKEIGVDAIEAQLALLEDRMREGLGNIRGIRLHGEGRGNGILSFTHREISQERLGELLSGEGFAVRAGLHCAPTAHRTLGTLDVGGTVRASLGYTNTKREVDHFLKALQGIARERAY